MNKHTIVKVIGYILYFISMCIVYEISVKAWICAVFATIGVVMYVYGKIEEEQEA